MESIPILTRLYNFFNRHRRKLVIFGFVAGGAVLLWKYAGKKVEEWRTLEAEECLANARKKHHFESNQQTCNMTVLSMIPKLRETLEKEIRVEKVVEELKTKPENKVQLWEDLKMMGFTRALVAVYASTLLTVFLRVQLNILGGYMYIGHCQENGKKDTHATKEVQKLYLEKLQYLLTDGVKDLISVVTEAVQNVLSRVTLKDKLSLADIETFLNEMRGQVEVLSSDNDFLHAKNQIHPLGRYLVQPEDINDESSACSQPENEDSLQHLMMETKDVIESNDFCRVLNNCLDVAFNRFLDNLTQYFRPPSNTVNGMHKEISPHSTHLPLAKVIPMVNNQTKVLCCDAPNHFIQELLLMQCVKDFAANVYEAFSQVSPAVNSI